MRLNSAFLSPSGRPRWLMMTIFAPFSCRVLIVGRLSMMRRSSSIWFSWFSGTLKSVRRMMV